MFPFFVAWPGKISETCEWVVLQLPVFLIFIGQLAHVWRIQSSPAAHQPNPSENRLRCEAILQLEQCLFWRRVKPLICFIRGLGDCDFSFNPCFWVTLHILNLETPKKLRAQLSATSLGSLVQSDLRSHMRCAVGRWRRLVKVVYDGGLELEHCVLRFCTLHFQKIQKSDYGLPKLSISRKEKASCQTISLLALNFTFYQ